MKQFLNNFNVATKVLFQCRLVASVGGNSGRHYIQNMMRTILNDPVAVLYSLSGKAARNAEKKPFQSTEFFNIITCKYLQYW